MSNENVAVLGANKQSSYAGDFVLENQEVAGKQGFSHVSKIWFDQCMTFDQGRAKVAADQAKIEDFVEPLSAWEPIVNSDGDVAFRRYADGREFAPTDHALKLVATVGRGMSEWALRALREPIRHLTKVGDDGEKIPLYQRGRPDAEVLRDYIKIHLFDGNRVDQSKPRLWRTWNDGTLRALLSTKYAIVNNGWFLSVLEKLIPGGRLSHWRGDADSIYGNILIPDTIRTESDSDYGGMLSIGNSEIGIRRISSLPSVFRAICMNGCIWDKISGEAIDRVHRGDIDYAELELAIKENLEKQIPLLPQGIERMLGIRAYGMGDTPVMNLMAQLSIDYSLSKNEIMGVWKELGTEVNLLGAKEANTAFGLQAAVTRYGQNLSPARWVAYDEIGGDIVNMTRDNWDGFRNRAANLTTKQVEKRLAVAV